MSLQLAPTTVADFEALVGGRPYARFRGVTAHLDGAPVAFGGLTYHPDGSVIAFFHGYDVVPRFPVAIHKAVKTGLAAARARGTTRVVALCDATVPAAERWLRRLGFVQSERPDIWVWEV